MQYISTRDNQKKFTLSEAMLQGLSPDGGLFIPEFIPKINIENFNPFGSYSEFCEKVLAPYFKGDKLEAKLPELCRNSFTFDVPLHPLNNQTAVMELFHGPTLSFKDFGARFLASSLNELATKDKITIMVATSGDTGSAVAAAFYQKPNIDVIVLFPENKISKRQQSQITCWGDNVSVFALQGVFDDCQRLLKQAFSDSWWQSKMHLCTANSINLGRFLPQICYYAYTSLRIFNDKKAKPGFIVPSGNLGNVTAAYYAKAMGFPIAGITIASNQNRVVSDYLETGEFNPKPSIATLANAMDVGKPSNFERLHYLFKDFETFKQNVAAYSVSDSQIKESILETYQQYDYVICPHTATANYARRYVDDQLWVVVATADPCKFETIIEPIIGHALPIPESLQNILNRKTQFKVILPTMEAIKKAVLAIPAE